MAALSRRNAALAGAAAVGALAVGAARRRRRAHPPLATLAGGTYSKLETSDGAVLNVHVAGDGPTVVLPHCWTGDMRVWEPVAAGLVARGHTVVRYDQRGHGSSTVGAEGYVVERLGDDLHELLQHIDGHDVVVAGHSMGGMTAQSFAIGHPDELRARVKALFLVSTASGNLTTLPLSRVLPLVVGSAPVERAMRAPGGAALLRGALGKNANPYAVALTRDTFVDTPAEVRLGQGLALLELDFLEARKTIDVPTTIVVGTRDTVTPPHLSQDMAAAIPGARLVTVPGAGHMLPLEATELLVDLMTEAAA